MRASVGIFLILVNTLLCRPVVAEELTREHCRAFAEHVQETAATVGDYEEATKKNNMVVDLAKATNGKIGGTASNAYKRFVQAMTEYRNSLEDLAHELQLCAR